MGVGYYPCHNCGEIICDAGDYGECKICEEDICLDCVDKLKTEYCGNCEKPAKNCECVTCNCNEEDCEKDHNVEYKFVSICRYCSGDDVSDENLIKFLLAKLNISKKEAKKEYLKN